MMVTLSGGYVVDGSGAEPRRADVAFEGDLIVDVGADRTSHGTVIDVAGCYVLPGFVDTHVHASPLLGDLASDVEIALLSQGVTTVILGGDGVGICPGGKLANGYASDYFAGIDGCTPTHLSDVSTVDELLTAIDRSSRINVGYLTPAGTLRQVVMPNDRTAANASQIGRMVDLLEQSLDEGSLGLATGLEYVPGGWASEEELIALCRSTANSGGIHASHMRHYENAVAKGLLELTELSEESGVRTHVAHMRAPADVALQALDSADQRGIRITFDSYPYLRGCTILAMRAIPSALRQPTSAGLLAQFAHHSVLTELRNHWAENADSFSDYVLAGAGCDEFRSHEGRTLGQAAASIDLTLSSYIEQLLVSSSAAATCLVPSSGASDEKDMARLLADSRHMACSDGIYVGGHPHPRGWGAFARVLEVHTGPAREWSWGQAAWHLSGHACERFAIPGRGLISPGRVADLVVVEPTKVRAPASYDFPNEPAIGVRRVFVSGAEVFRDGALTGRKAGRSIRRGTGGYASP